MLPRERDYARAGRRVQAALRADAELSGDAVIERFLEETADVLQITSSCWHLTDPASGTPVSNAAIGDPPGSFAESIDYEFRRRDVNTFPDLQASGRRSAAITLATGARPSDSLRFREMIKPVGPADELRILFADAFGPWAALVAFTDRRMTAEDVRFAEELAVPAAEALRGAVAAQVRADARAGGLDDNPAPSVLILDPQDRVLAADAVARRRLALLQGAGDGSVPGLLSYLAARARWGPAAQPSTSRMRTAQGEWFVLDASLLEDDEDRGSVAIVMRPAPARAVLDSVLRSLGLSAREREVAGLVAQGLTAKAIAAQLALSPWTISDHLKAIYQKAGVNGRSGLAALTGSARLG
jgi:DNA-binding CsgD family transcriptional regulator